MFWLGFGAGVLASVVIGVVAFGALVFAFAMFVKPYPGQLETRASERGRE